MCRENTSCCRLHIGKDQNIPQAPASAYKELYKILLVEIRLITENKNPYGEKVKLIPDFLIHQETHRKELQKEVKPKQMGISRFFCLFVCLFLNRSTKYVFRLPVNNRRLLIRQNQAWLPS